MAAGIIITALIVVAFVVKAHSTLRNNENSLVEHQIICNPSTSKLLSRFLIQRFLDARKEIGLGDAAESLYNKRNITYFDSAEFVLLKYYSFNPEAVLFLTTNGHVIPYVRLFKCANEGISANIFLLTVKKKTILANGIRLNAKHQSFESTLIPSLAHNNPKRVVSNPIFTFVRDPIQRFMSGFTETIYKHHQKYKIFNPDGSEFKINETIAKNYLIELLNFRPSLFDIEHIYPMVGAFTHFNIEVVGSVENMKHDWENKIKPLYNINATYDNKVGQHETSAYHPMTILKKAEASKDPNNARAVIKAILSKETKFSRAFCHLLLIDYICLPKYILPSKCMFLSSIRDAAIAAILSNRFVAPMSIFVE